MPDQTQPTHQDVHNAEMRAAIAERQNAVYAEAMRLVLGACGPGWSPWMLLCLIPSDHRHTGDTTPVATVVKAYRGEEKLTENSVFIRRMPDGRIAKADSYEPLFGDLLTEKHLSKTVEVRGQQVPVGRYELCWSALEVYRPKDAAGLAKLRESRERGKLEREEKKWVEENPLLAWAERVQKEEEGRGRCSSTC